MYRQAFVHSTYEKELNEKGYAVIPLLNCLEVQNVKAFYEQKKPADFDENQGFHSTHFSRDRAYKKEVDTFLTGVFSTLLSEQLLGYKIKFCNFMVKEPGEGSIMPLHTDWTYVDESKFRSLALWVPLIDTRPQNGALGVVAGSHLLPAGIRGPKIPHPFHPFNERIIEHFGELIPMKAGEGLIYDHRLMHYSPPNLSETTRVAINVILTPEEALLFHYCKHDDENLIHEYSVEDDDFFVCYDAFDFPEKATQTKQFPAIPSAYSWGMIESVVKKKPELPFIERLLQKTRQIIGSGL